MHQGFPPLPSGDCGPPSQICLGEKVKGEMNLVEILPPASQEEKRTKPITIASLQASVLPTVSLAGRPGTLLLSSLRGWASCHSVAMLERAYGP